MGDACGSNSECKTPDGRGGGRRNNLDSGAAGGPGTLKAAVQGPGDPAMSSPFTVKDSGGADFSLADDTFGITMGKDSANRWVLACVVYGETGISEWYSADWDARTFTRVV